MTVALFFVYRATKFGRLASAVAENQRAAASLGHSPGRVAVANWALGSALAALAGALIAPIAYLVPSSLVLLVVPGLAAALVGEFSSFPLAFIGALFIGVMESLATIYITTPGWSDSVPFLVIIVVLIARGTALPLRSFIFDRLPAVGNGKLRPKPTAAVMVVAALLLWFVLQPTWVLAVSVTMVWAIFCLSVVVLTGYAGQLSLAQFVLGGVGAFAAARLMASWHFAFLPAAILGIVITVAFGLVVALPALRTRGINLAIATLGLGIVVFSLILSSYQWAGGDTGITVKSPTLFGWNFSAISFPRRCARRAGRASPRGTDRDERAPRHHRTSPSRRSFERACGSGARGQRHDHEAVRLRSGGSARRRGRNPARLPEHDRHPGPVRRTDVDHGDRRDRGRRPRFIEGPSSVRPCCPVASAPNSSSPSTARSPTFHSPPASFCSTSFEPVMISTHRTRTCYASSLER